MLIDLLRSAAAAAPARAAIIGPEGEVSYAACLTRAEAVAAALRSAGIDRFGSAVAGPEDIVVLLAAASAAGSEACLYPRDLDTGAIGSLARTFGHRVVVTDGDVKVAGVETVGFQSLVDAAPVLLPRPERTPVLILTTGTTGAQKGARHDWARLVQAVRRPDAAAGTRWLLAYNLNQFAGIQILLHVLRSGASLVVPATRRAEEVVDAIRDHGVTHVSATPTFWRLVVGLLESRGAESLRLEQITLGGEATPAGLIERLRRLFPAARISHVYAGTEFGSAVSVNDGLSGLPLSVLERPADAEVQLRVVDGELHARSRVGMLGYHESDDDESGWRATGDLVEIRDDRIHFVGRTTEMINVGGAKIHPLPLEELACSVPGVQLAAVYGRPNPVTGQIVAMDVVTEPGADVQAVETAIRAVCESLPAAGRPRRIRFVPELEVRGNKLIRNETGSSQ